MIKAGDEECDNGKKLGCPNCIKDLRFNCRLASNGRASICRRK